MRSFNILQKIAKKNRKTVLAVACFVLITALEITVSFVSKETKIISDTNKLTGINKVKISKIEDQIDASNLQLQNIVKRISFNAYIRHTDDRFKVINETNEKLLQSMGIITGRVSGLEKIIYALNMYELHSGSKQDYKCKETPQAKGK